MTQLSRRRFVASSIGAAGTAAAAAVHAQPAAKEVSSERIRVGCIGGGGRAGALVRTFSASPQADVVAIADLDPLRLGPAIEASAAIQGRTPRAEQDFRRIIDDPMIDAVVVGTPDHWHAIPTILACLNGKDVYVEKPDAHNIVEGRRMVAAMTKHQRVVQMGSQHRSTERLQSALEFIRSGALGQCLVAKAWESSRQGDIGRPADSDPPQGVDYDMWLGSAPQRPFNRNRFHGRWRWFYDYGTGDLGNDGVHRLDMAVAALSAALEAEGAGPLGALRRISATGGKWYFDDMQEWPDTLQVNYEFAGIPPRLLTYEMRVWCPYQMYGETEGAVVYGDQAYIIIGNTRWRAFSRNDEPIAEGAGDSFEGPHVEDFLTCVKTRNRPRCDLATVGHAASVLCHAGNIAARVGRTLTLAASDETFDGDPAANDLRGRPEWRRPWVLPEV